MTQKNMNIEKILGAGRQEIVSDLTKSCFSEKRLQKLEKRGQGKNRDWNQTPDMNSRKKSY